MNLIPRMSLNDMIMNHCGLIPTNTNVVIRFTLNARSEKATHEPPLWNASALVRMAIAYSLPIITVVILPKDAV